MPELSGIFTRYPLLMFLWMVLWGVGAFWTNIHIHRHYIKVGSLFDPRRKFFDDLEFVCIVAALLPMILALYLAAPEIMGPVYLVGTLIGGIMIALAFMLGRRKRR